MSTPAPAPQAPVVDWRKLMANAALGIVGDTGTGKTTLLVTLAEYVYQKYGKVTRYYSIDPGGFGDMMYSLIVKGVVEVWRMRTRDVDGQLSMPTGTCALASRGYWPVERDPLTGVTRPGVPLVPPYLTMHTLVCPKGHDVRTSYQPGLFSQPTRCPQCEAMVSSQNCKEVRKEYRPVAGFDRVGAVMFDSGTAMCNWCMTDTDARAGRNELGGIKGAINTVHSDGIVFGTAGMSGVGFVQNRVQDWINNAIAIPGLVVPPAFTFHWDRGSDQGGAPVYGPKLIGSAKTAESPGWLGNCFGVEGPAAVGEHRIYLSQYQLKDGVTRLVKHRAAAGLMPEYLADPTGATIENGQAYTKFNLGHVLDLLLAAVEKTNARAEKLFPEAPGLGSGKLEVPDGFPLKTEAAAPLPGQVVRTVAAQPAQGVAVASPSTPAAAPQAQAQAQAQGKAAPAPAAGRAVSGRTAAVQRPTVVAQRGAAPAAAPAAPAAPAPPAAAPAAQPAPAPAPAPPAAPQSQPQQQARPAGAPLPPAVAPRGAAPRPPAVAPITSKK